MPPFGKNHILAEELMKKFGHVLVLMLLLCGIVAGCGEEKNNAAILRIATKPMTEQLILGEMLSLLIEEKMGVKAELVKGIGGGTANIHPALLQGQFDLYPEYTGTAWSYVLKKEDLLDDAELLQELRKEYARQFELEWVGMYGFNNTYGLLLHKDIAEKHSIRTFSDLASQSNSLVFGAEYDFYEREDGYDALCETYGYVFKNRVDLDIGLKYPAFAGRKVDVMNIFTTDGQLPGSGGVVLVDDKHFYRTYYCGTVVRKDALKKYPGLKETLLLMNNILRDDDMAALNHQVEEQKLGEREVARKFLQSKNLIP